VRQGLTAFAHVDQPAVESVSFGAMALTAALESWTRRWTCVEYEIVRAPDVVAPLIAPDSPIPVADLLP